MVGKSFHLSAVGSFRRPLFAEKMLTYTDNGSFLTKGFTYQWNDRFSPLSIKLNKNALNQSIED